MNTEEPGAPDVTHDRRLGRRFWATTIVGWAIIAYGLRGLLHHHIDTRPPNLARFVVLSALVHDLVFAPVVLGLGVAVRALLRGRARTYVQTALLASGIVALFAYPLIRGYGHSLANNPGYLPHNYTADLAVVVAAIWLASGLAYAVTARRP